MDLGPVVDLVVEHVCGDDALAPRLAPGDGAARRLQLAALLRCAAAGPAGGGPDPPVLDLDHAAFSLLASHVADALDALSVDEVLAADLLAGLAAARDRVVGPGPAA